MSTVQTSKSSLFKQVHVYFLEDYMSFVQTSIQSIFQLCTGLLLETCKRLLLETCTRLLFEQVHVKCSN